MQRCSEKAYAMCPTRQLCGPIDEATFTDDSECALFNRSVEDKPMTNADRIRAMNGYELAVFFAKTKAALHLADLPVIAYSAQDMNNNLEWLMQPSERG